MAGRGLARLPIRGRDDESRRSRRLREPRPLLHRLFHGALPRSRRARSREGGKRLVDRTIG